MALKTKLRESDMATERERQIAGRNKYRRLYWHLCDLDSEEWRATFREIEAVLDFALPPSARRYQVWWGNERGRARHSQSFAWSASGWETAELDLGAETVVFRKARPSLSGRKQNKEGMSLDLALKRGKTAIRSKYRKLFWHLCALNRDEWRTTFKEIEAVLDFKLPSSARRYSAWWANGPGSGHSHANAWAAAGWKTAELDLGAETVVFRRMWRPQFIHKLSFDELFPVHPTARWPKEGMSLRREDIYDDRVY